MSGNQREEDPLKKTPAYYLKAGSSSSIREWKDGCAEMVRPRSALLERPASHPQLVADLSVEAVEESIYRRTLHEYLFKEEPNAFKKLFLPESPSEFYLQRHLVRDFLLDLHEHHAPRDVATPKFPITKSLKEKPPPVELRSVIEDFLQPKNLTRRRVTGYSPGHIRSLLDLDTFGPNHSQKVEMKRSTGLLPMSPNASRFSPGNRRLSGISETATRAQTAPTLSRPSVKFDETVLSPSQIMKLNINTDDDMSADSGGTKSNASFAKSTFSKSVIEIAELDEDIRKSNPTYKRLQYAKNHKNKIERKIQRKVEKKKSRKMADKLRAEISEYKESLDDFEKNILKTKDQGKRGRFITLL